MKRSVTLEMASKVSDNVSGRPCLATAERPAASNLTIVPRQAVRDWTEDREQIGQRRRKQQQESRRAEQRDDDAQAKRGHRANQRGLHDRDGHAAAREPDPGSVRTGRSRPRARPPPLPPWHPARPGAPIRKRRARPGSRSRYPDITRPRTSVPSFRACPLRIRLRNQPDQEGADDRGESDAEQIDAVIMRREQPRENEDAQQPQQCRKDVGG